MRMLAAANTSRQSSVTRNGNTRRTNSAEPLPPIVASLARMLPRNRSNVTGSSRLWPARFSSELLTVSRPKDCGCRLRHIAFTAPQPRSHLPESVGERGAEVHERIALFVRARGTRDRQGRVEDTGAHPCVLGQRK